MCELTDFQVPLQGIDSVGLCRTWGFYTLTSSWVVMPFCFITKAEAFSKECLAEKVTLHKSLKSQAECWGLVESIRIPGDFGERAGGCHCLHGIACRPAICFSFKVEGRCPAHAELNKPVFSRWLCTWSWVTRYHLLVPDNFVEVPPCKAKQAFSG